eukprot:10265705-Alexandrium_andersonii.AAC.1
MWPATSARAATMLRQSQAACASRVASLDTNTTRAASPGSASRSLGSKSAAKPAANRSSHASGRAQRSRRNSK